MCRESDGLSAARSSEWRLPFGDLSKEYGAGPSGAAAVFCESVSVLSEIEGLLRFMGRILRAILKAPAPVGMRIAVELFQIVRLDGENAAVEARLQSPQEALEAASTTDGPEQSHY
jgi:hypothetical protein